MTSTVYKIENYFCIIFSELKTSMYVFTFIVIILCSQDVIPGVQHKNQHIHRVYFRCCFFIEFSSSICAIIMPRIEANDKANLTTRSAMQVKHAKVLIMICLILIIEHTV